MSTQETSHSEKMKRWWQAHPEARKRGKYSADRIEKMRLSLLGRKQSPESNKKRSETLKGRVFSLEHRKKISVSMMGKLVGRKLSEEHKQKVRLNNSRYWLGKHKSEETKAKISLARSKQVFPYKDTSIERIVQAYLNQMNIPFKKHVPFRLPTNRFHQVDLYLPEIALVIECDGTYWHNLPGEKEHDAYIDASLSKIGYKVLRLSQEEISDGTFKSKLHGVGI